MTVAIILALIKNRKYTIENRDNLGWLFKKRCLTSKNKRDF